MAPKPRVKTRPAKSGKSRASQKQKATVEKVTPNTKPRAKDQFGYQEGTDSSITAQALYEGGFERTTIYKTIRERIEESSDNGLTTRNGTEKNIPNLVATVLRQLRSKGYIVESHWRLVKDENFVPEETEGDNKASTKKATAKKAAKTPATKTAPAKRTTRRKVRKPSK